MKTLAIVPCYNEANRLKVDEFKAFACLHPGIHFLFANDGSSDNTLDIITKLSSEHPQMHYFDLQPNGGKGEVVRRAMLYAFENFDTQ